MVMISSMIRDPQGEMNTSNWRQQSRAPEPQLKMDLAICPHVEVTSLSVILAFNWSNYSELPLRIAVEHRVRLFLW